MPHHPPSDVEFPPRAGRSVEPIDPVDAAMMRRALALAERGVGRTSPNPPVGCVVVRDGAVVGEGRTAPAGGPHAEVVALAAAGPAAAGATAYVTLEPCAHHGRTPPCADALVAAGVARVVYALRDPNPRVDGAGAARLAAAGVAVEADVGADAAAALYAPFARWIATGRPFVTAKWAMSLDGRIATRSGDSRWISGSAARALAHRLRDRVDAVLVGAGTIRADDPELTVRLAADAAPPDGRQPLRVVLAGRRGVPPAARLFDTTVAPTLVVAAGLPAGQAAALAARGVEVVVVAGRAGRVDVDAVLDALGRRGLLHVLVEGGAAIHGSFAAARAIDAVWAVVAPLVIGGAAAPGPVGGRGAARLADAMRLADVTSHAVGDDIVIEGRPIWPADSARRTPADPERTARTAADHPGTDHTDTGRTGADRTGTDHTDTGRTDTVRVGARHAVPAPPA